MDKNEKSARKKLGKNIRVACERPAAEETARRITVKIGLKIATTTEELKVIKEIALSEIQEQCARCLLEGKAS
jgi:hypothetical protein